MSPTTPPSEPISRPDIPMAPSPQQPRYSTLPWVIGAALLGAGVVIGFLVAWFMGHFFAERWLDELFLTLAPAPTTDPAANWETYTVRTVGLEFKLPNGLKENSPFEEMVRPGDTGKYLCATFNASTMFSACTPNSFGIGTTSPNFTAGRGGVFLDFLGFRVKDGKYYAKFLSNTESEIPKELVKEINNSQGVKILRIVGRDQTGEAGPILGSLGEGYVGALLNISNHPDFTGLAVIMKLGNVTTIDLFDQILSTFKFTGTPASTPPPTSASNVKILKYTLPDGWQTVQDLSGQFEIGYDPETMKSDPKDSLIYLEKPKTTPGTWQFVGVELRPYSDGSRHQFIYDRLGEKPQAQDLTPSYHEVEYRYNNRSCLFLIGISISQYPQTWGMCDAGGGQALIIWSYDDKAYEQVVQTIRLK